MELSVHSCTNDVDRKAYEDALRSRGYEMLDLFEEQCSELASIRDPRSFGTTPTPLVETPRDMYVEYPWRRCAIRIIEKSAYTELRSNRNIGIFTHEEQQRFADTHVAFAGLNVGNPGAVCVALEGGSYSMSLVDPDILSTTNLNRFRAGLPDVTTNKAELTARQILEIDPYYTLHVSTIGLTPDSLEQFLTKPKASVLVEEMDALPLKLLVRDVARKFRIPVVMVTGIGEGVLLDVERYDLDPDMLILNGLLDTSIEQEIRSGAPITPQRKMELAHDFIGTTYLEPRLHESFGQLGVTLAGIPQVAESSFLRGGVICHAVRAIASGKELPSGRYSFTFSSLYSS